MVACIADPGSQLFLRTLYSAATNSRVRRAASHRMIGHGSGIHRSQIAGKESSPPALLLGAEKAILYYLTSSMTQDLVV